MHRTQSDLERLDPAFITHNVIMRDLTFYHVKLTHCTTLVEQKRFFFRVISIASYSPAHLPPMFSMSSLQTHPPPRRVIFHSPLLSQRTFKLFETSTELAIHSPKTEIDSRSFDGAKVRGTETKILLSVVRGQTL